MKELLSVLPLGLILFAYLIWGFRTLPQERWQFIAALPLAKDADGHWRGVNLTYYGLFSAVAYVVAVATLLVLLGAIAVPVGRILALTVAVLAVCVPASRVVAGIVEKKSHTFSVAGAFFTALFAVPLAVFFLNLFADASQQTLPYLPAMAAAAIAYAFGEGLGRLGCIRFGCCSRPRRPGRVSPGPRPVAAAEADATETAETLAEGVGDGRGGHHRQVRQGGGVRGGGTKE